MGHEIFRPPIQSDNVRKGTVRSAIDERYPLFIFLLVRGDKENFLGLWHVSSIFLTLLLMLCVIKLPLMLLHHHVLSYLCVCTICEKLVAKSWLRKTRQWGQQPALPWWPGQRTS